MSIFSTTLRVRKTGNVPPKPSQLNSPQKSDKSGKNRQNQNHGFQYEGAGLRSKNLCRRKNHRKKTEKRQK